MRQIITILFLTILTASCNSGKQKFIIQTENQYDTIEGKEQIVSQTIKKLRVTDSLPISILTKVSNYNNDTRLKYLTGLGKDDGLQDYMLDSIYYDSSGNDTLKKSFVHLDNNWQPVQTYYKKFTSDKQVSYFMTERPFKKDFYSKKETFYVYDKNGKILTETEAECSLRNAGFSRCDCDSIFKTKYIYNTTGKLDSTIYYTWTNNEWTEHKKKNGR
ncbi:MAG: hypothetical protein WCH34_04880 [Bacteroidota bacterium]